LLKYYDLFFYYVMSTVLEIEAAIDALPAEALADLVTWMDRKRIAVCDEFDRRIEADAKSGKLARLAEAARLAHREGKTVKLP
jgi:hypothetical protein